MVLTVSAMLMALVALPAGAQEWWEDEFGTKGEEESPGEVECDWVGPFEEPPYDPWWEYWCWWPGWGWEFVFWVWA